MNIASICQRPVITIESDASVREAAASMRDNHVGALVVIDAVEPSRVTGVVTDRDLAIEVLAGDVARGGISIGQLVNGALVSVPGSGSLQDAVIAMEEGGVRRLLVTDGGGRVIGFLSSDDVLDAVAAEIGGLSRALRSGIARENAERPPEHPVFLPLRHAGHALNPMTPAAAVHPGPPAPVAAGGGGRVRTGSISITAPTSACAAGVRPRRLRSSKPRWR